MVEWDAKNFDGANEFDVTQVAELRNDVISDGADNLKKNMTQN